MTIGAGCATNDPDFVVKLDTGVPDTGVPDTAAPDTGFPDTTIDAAATDAWRGTCSPGQAGQTDTTFGTAGVVSAEGLAEAYGLVVQRDGTIMVSGSANPPGIFVARYTPDGTLDPAFAGGKGYVTSAADIAHAGGGLAITRSGAILTAGMRAGPGGTGAFVVQRYSQDGQLDTSFGEGGTVTIRHGATDSWIAEVLLQRDGKLIVYGDVGEAGPMIFEPMVYRLLPDGRLDQDFGQNGRVVLRAGQTGRAALDAQNRIVCSSQSNGRALVVRLGANGQQDASFGDGAGGVDIGATHALIGGVRVDSGGLIYVAGLLDDQLALVRLTAQGQIDVNFGDNGRGQGSFPAHSQAVDLAIQPDGAILVAGSSPGNSFVVRYLLNGQLDPAFGTDGVTTTASMLRMIAVQDPCHAVHAGARPLATRYFL